MGSYSKTLPLGTNHPHCAGRLTRFPKKILSWVSRANKSIETNGVEETIFLKVSLANIRIISFLFINKMLTFFNTKAQVILSPETNTIVIETHFLTIKKSFNPLYILAPRALRHTLSFSANRFAISHITIQIPFTL
jgi:hypothetical protein